MGTLQRDADTELEQLRGELEAARETLRAIRSGAVDAVVTLGGETPVIYTLKNAADPYRLLVEQMREGALTVSSEGVIVYCNLAFTQIVGVASERLRGTLLKELVVDQRVLAALLAPRGTRGREIQLRTAQGDLRAVHVSSAPLLIDGASLHCLVATDLSRQELRLRHDAIVSASADAIYSVATDGTIATWNAAAERFYGYAAQEAIGQHVRMLTPGDQTAADATLACLSAGRPCRLETEHVSKRGHRLDAALSVAPIEGADGIVEAFAVVARDIADRKAALRRQTLLLHELAHRGKNLMAVIQAIANNTLTSATTVAAARDTFGSRLHALARTYDALLANDFKGVPISQIAHAEIAAFHARAHIAGPDLLLSDKAGQTLTLAIHELATNAAKYGALSVPGGKVAVTWAVEGESLHFTWREAGGPPVAQPERQGFGSRILTAILPAQFATAAHLEFSQDGLLYRFTAPLSALLPAEDTRFDDQ